MVNSVIKKFIKIIFLVIWMIIIFLFSADSAEESSKKSNTLIYKVGEVIAGRSLTHEEKKDIVDKFVFVVRKGAHFVIYIILGILAINVFCDVKTINFKLIIYSIIFCLIYAISDEVHQLFIPGRSCEIRDILIDLSGSIIGVLLYSFIYRLRRRNYE